MPGMVLSAPRHLRLGTYTACGLHGVQHRAIATTQDEDRVSCRNCRRWMKNRPPAAEWHDRRDGVPVPPTAKDVTP